MTYGLIGEHLPHSFSEEIHGKCASYEYELHELAPDEVGAFMETADFCAVNVTIPYKQTVIPYLYEIHPQARAIGAVNTVVNRGGKLYGYNTDFYGMLSLARHIGVDMKGKKVLVLGTGGTARTARALAVSEGARCILTVGRVAGEGVISYEQAYDQNADAEIIINTTPCGMFPHADGAAHIAPVAVDVSRFPRLEGAMDAVYNPLRTNLVMDCRKRGIPAEGGLYMLVGQAVVASRVFLGEEIEAVAADPTTHETIERIYRDIFRNKENIVLTGMPGSGKSTVGVALAESLGRPFLDTDALIVEKTGKAISDIFAEMGETGFREIESEVVRDTADNATGCVIATGGGAILRDGNVRALGRNGRIYFLDRPLEELLPTEDRPLASTADAIRRRYAERYERYCATADRRVEIDGGVSHIVNKIREDFLK